MTHQIKDKITTLTTELKQSVEEYQRISNQKNSLFNHITSLQGALKALKEVDHEHTDQPTEGNAS